MCFFSINNKAFSEFLASQKLDLMFNEMIQNVIAFHDAPKEVVDGMENVATVSVWHSYVHWALTVGKL